MHAHGQLQLTADLRACPHRLDYLSTIPCVYSHYNSQKYIEINMSEITFDFNAGRKVRTSYRVTSLRRCGDMVCLKRIGDE